MRNCFCHTDKVEQPAKHLNAVYIHFKAGQNLLFNFSAFPIRLYHLIYFAASIDTGIRPVLQDKRMPPISCCDNNMKCSRPALLIATNPALPSDLGSPTEQTCSVYVATFCYSSAKWALAAPQKKSPDKQYKSPDACPTSLRLVPSL